MIGHCQYTIRIESGQANKCLAANSTSRSGSLSVGGIRAENPSDLHRPPTITVLPSRLLSKTIILDSSHHHDNHLKTKL